MEMLATWLGKFRVILVVSTKGAAELTIETFWRELRILGDCGEDSTLRRQVLFVSSAFSGLSWNEENLLTIPTTPPIKKLCAFRILGSGCTIWKRNRSSCSLGDNSTSSLESFEKLGKVLSTRRFHEKESFAEFALRNISLIVYVGICGVVRVDCGKDEAEDCAIKE